jgi:hypothetical protein
LVEDEMMHRSVIRFAPAGARLVLVAVVSLLALLTGSCSSRTDGPPRETARKMAMALQGTSVVNTSNFNGTPIPAGRYIWFTSVIKVSGVGSSPAQLFLTDSSIQFSANGQSYSLPVPDARVLIDPQATTASTTFNSASGRWETTLPVQFSGNAFLSGLSYLVPVNLPGGINPVSWVATFTTDTPGLTVTWQWSAAHNIT